MNMEKDYSKLTLLRFYKLLYFGHSITSANRLDSQFTNLSNNCLTNERGLLKIRVNMTNNSLKGIVGIKHCYRELTFGGS